MAPIKAQDVKKLLLTGGFLVYRTNDQAVFLAERVRENLIMDANVSIFVQPLRLRFVVRAQRSDFPSSSDTPVSLFDRARTVAANALALGYREVQTEVVPQLDPMDPALILDTWYQVTFERPISVEELSDSVVQALRFDKIVPR